MKIEHLYQDKSTLFRALRDYCLQALRSDLLDHDEVTWFVSGGSTPVPLYRLLAQAPLPWNRVCTALVDERWVDTGHPASNEGMLRKTFDGNTALLQNLTGMMIPNHSAAGAEPQCNARYATMPPQHSLCLLGMGPDGHTASLFPGATGLREALSENKFCKAITAIPSEVTGAHIERMSLTLHAILSCKRVVLLFTGPAKWEVYEQALDCHDSERLPVSAVLNQDAQSVDVFYSP